MDVDNSDLGATAAQPSTPRMLRKEIEKAKTDIAGQEKVLKQLLTNLLAGMSTEALGMVADDLKSRRSYLSVLEEKQGIAEKAIELRAKLAIENSIHSGLAAEGPDSAYIPDTKKFLQMKSWLDTEKVVLLRSPPGSGKTSFAVYFAQYLRQHSFPVYYFNAAQMKNRVTEKRSLDDIWKNMFNLTFWEFFEASQKDFPTYIIMDEAQAWYPANVESNHAKDELDAFWRNIKASCMPMHERTNYGAGLGLEMTAPSPDNVRLLCLAGYGEPKLGPALVFMDPVDPGTQMRLPLGLNVLRLNRDNADLAIAKFVEIKNKEGKMSSFSLDRDVRDKIFDEANGHVGVIRTLLSHLVQMSKRTKEDVRDFFSSSVCQSNRTFLATHEDEIQALSPLEIALLVQGIVAYKRGELEFSVRAKEVSELIKRGLFIKSSETTFSGQTMVAFPSPLHFDLVLYTLLHRKIDLVQSHVCFEQALKEMVLRMSPRLLQDTTPIDYLPFEDQWQEECTTSFRAMTQKTITAEYGRQHNQVDYLDLYVSELEWGIELIRQGVGERLDEHVGHLRSDSRYRKFPMQNYAVLNFTHITPNDETLNKYDHVWHLVYNKMYTKVTVYRNNKPLTEWHLIGYQSRHEY